MNYRMIIYVMGQISKVVGLAMLLPVLVGFIYGETHIIASFGIPILILLIPGFAVTIKKPKDNSVYSMEGFISVAASWVVVSAVCALPFVISGDIPNYVDALFETVSGFTTTGSSILGKVEELSRASLFWRSFTHWLGGMGIIMIVLAIMSSNDSRAMHMMRAECPGPKVGRLVSKSGNSARILYGIYIVLTVIEIIMLLFGGLSFYDAVVHTFSSAGTGGFSIYGNSIAHYNSLYVEMVIAVFIIIFGVNFNLYYYLLIRRFSMVFKNEELRTYLGIILTVTLLIALNIRDMYSGFLESLRYSFFMTASTITSTGFSVIDTNTWPVFSQTLLLMIMFIGSCAGSTGGGLKVSRVIIMFKAGVKELKYIINPRSVSSVKMDGKPVERDVVRGVTSYFIIYILLMFASILLVTLDRFTIEESASAVITTMNNIGFGVGTFGSAGNFGGMSSFSKIVLCFDMLIGRLEIYPIILLLAVKRK